MRVLVVDLNNFARYPSIAIGYIVAELRRTGIEVEVFSPLSVGAMGVVRERRPRAWSGLDLRLRYDSAVSQNRVVTRVRDHLARRRLPELAKRGSLLREQFAEQLDSGSFDVVLVSTYLMYFDACMDLGDLCSERGIPLVIGGPYFTQPETARVWMEIPGLSALIGGEIELEIGDLVQRIGAGGSVEGMKGVWSPGEDGPRLDSPPLADLDRVSFPDFSDFPWEKYQKAIVPVITGRGCGWGRCTFCSDIASTAGRTYRSRSPENVLDELEHQHNRYSTKLFAFTDLKLNSDHAVWSSLLYDLPERVPGAQWFGSVHANAGGGDGLSREELMAAKKAGMVRLTTGLESGSQRVLNTMKKGTKLSETARLIRDAHDAGISVQVTMIIGYPGEKKEDIDATISFLAELDGCIERVVINRFQVIVGTEVQKAMGDSPNRFPGVTDLTINNKMSQVSHQYSVTQSRAYRKAIHRLLGVAHRVNRRPLSVDGRAFDGVM